MQPVVMQIELPSSNRAEDIRRFLTEINAALHPALGIALVIQWRSNRRFLTLQRTGTR